MQLEGITNILIKKKEKKKKSEFRQWHKSMKRQKRYQRKELDIYE